MNIDSIRNGVVIDHITAGKAMELYELMGLDKIDAPVALIKNASSSKMGKKDIIKIDADYDVNLDIIGYAEPDCTINIIRDSRLAEKKKITVPKKLVNVIKCRNPRCITCCEQELDQVFVLTDEAKRTYRCIYCETQAK